MNRLFIIIIAISVAFVQCDSGDNPVSDNGETTEVEAMDSISVHSVSLVYNSISNDHLYFTTNSMYSDAPYGHSYALDLEIEFNNEDDFDQIERMILYSEYGVGWEFDDEILRSLYYQDSTLFIPNIILITHVNRDLKFELECFDGSGNSLDTYEFIMKNRFPSMLSSDHSWLSSNSIDITYNLPSNTRDFVTNLSVSWVDTLQNILGHEELVLDDLTSDNSVQLNDVADNLFGFYSEIALNTESVRQEIITGISNVADNRPPDNIVKSTNFLIKFVDFQDDFQSTFKANGQGDFFYFDSREGLIYEYDGTNGSIQNTHELISSVDTDDFGRYAQYNAKANLFAYLSSSQEISAHDLTAGNTLFSKEIDFSSEELHVADSMLFIAGNRYLKAYVHSNSVVSEIDFETNIIDPHYLHYIPEDSMMYIGDYYGLYAVKLNFESSESTTLAYVETTGNRVRDLYDISSDRIVNSNGTVTQLNKDSEGYYTLSVIDNFNHEPKDLLMLEDQNLLLMLKEGSYYEDSDILYVYDLNTLEKINEIKTFYDPLALGVSGNTVRIFEHYYDRLQHDENYSLAIESYDISELRTVGKTHSTYKKVPNKLPYFLPFNK